MSHCSPFRFLSNDDTSGSYIKRWTWQFIWQLKNFLPDLEKNWSGELHDFGAAQMKEEHDAVQLTSILVVQLSLCLLASVYFCLLGGHYFLLFAFFFSSKYWQRKIRQIYLYNIIHYHCLRWKTILKFKTWLKLFQLLRKDNGGPSILFTHWGSQNRGDAFKPWNSKAHSFCNICGLNWNKFLEKFSIKSSVKVN